MNGSRSSPEIGARITALIFLVVVAANAVSFPYVGTGSRWTSRRFWFGRAAILMTAAGAAWRIKERSHRRRQKALELAVAERTELVDRQRRNERERNIILEFLISNQPLPTVLDALARLVGSQCPGSLCVILTKRSESCHVAAAPGLPKEWLMALGAPYAVPFEVWRKPVETTQPDSNPAWKVFATSLIGKAPAAIYSWPIGDPEMPFGAILLFYREATVPNETDTRAAEEARRMARIAMEHRRLYDDLHFQAHHDSLTGLPNRMLYEERLSRALREAEVLGQKVGLFFIDLDRFKQINDTCSHRVGDLLLSEVARRMKSALRSEDTAARIGGDEFTIIVNDIRDVADAAGLAARVLGLLRQPMLIDGQQIDISASAGFAIFPEDGTDPEQLERAADAAMYHAKEMGRDRAEAFATRNESLDRVRMEEEIRLALRHGYFVVYYQPKVGSDRRVVGLEALVRLNHPELGLIPPASFIPIAESTGLIVPLGAWVLEEACRQIAEWESHGLRQVPVAVNVSPVQICRSDFAASVEDCLLRHRISAANLELELTEGLLINAAGVAQEQLRALRALGVQLSIDDFGTGYSSLSYLYRLEIDCIKLDRSFVQAIDTDELARRLVQSMMGVAQGLGLTVVAEGVETEGQRTALIAAGCGIMQGYLFSRPQPPDELEEFLRNNPPPSATAPSHSSDLMGLADSIRLAGMGAEALSSR
jgi:diguanylate cyclase (GGDEF)-like protein